jgi:hypothetical protein
MHSVQITEAMTLRCGREIQKALTIGYADLSLPSSKLIDFWVFNDILLTASLNVPEGLPRR